MENPEPLKALPAGETERGITREGAAFLALALGLLIASYLLMSIFPAWQSPLGFLLITAAVYVITTAAALLLGARPGLLSAAALAIGLIAAMYRMVHGCAQADIFPVMLISLFVYAYYVLTLFSNHSGRIGCGLLMDFVKGLSYMFVSFHEFFIAIFKPKGSRKRPFAVLLVTGGVLASAIFVIAVASLLSYDANFKALLPEISLEDVLSAILKLSLAVPLAAMLFSAVASSRKRLFPALSSEETVSKAGSQVKVIPAILIVMPVAALLIVYALFFISQRAYYLSAFTHTLPEGYSAAEYAREGFFQLLAVTIINLVLIVLLGCFMRNRSRSADILRRVLAALLSAAALLLITTAVSKMLLYIDRFDLSRARLEATVFMLFLAAVFAAVLLSSVFKRVKAAPIIAVAAVIFFVAFSLTNTNRFVAKYNVDMYLSGKHSDIDVEYLENNLGWSSAPELRRLSECAQGDVRERAERSYENMKARSGEVEWYRGDIPYYTALKDFSDD